MPSIFFIILIAFALYQCVLDPASIKDVKELGREITETVIEQLEKTREQLEKNKEEIKVEKEKTERKYREIP